MEEYIRQLKFTLRCADTRQKSSQQVSQGALLVQQKQNFI